ncbi:type I secretion system permease/ATPase [Aestuariivirga litoralis]|uniref:type I secretion system permease/ATPase n=1 Tax=Aestuariivirga litoralis TaxID=2650924 RepID=UPI0018C5FB80|nr:type I secretion system permease/ATPase [Aestuariivirga litoralis]
MTGDNEIRAQVFGRNRKLIIVTFIFSFVINILALSGSLFMLQVYDRVIPSGSIPTLVALAGIVLLLYCYFGLLDYVRSRIFVRVGKRLEESLRLRAFDVMSKAALSKTNTAGTLPVQDLAAIRQFISGQGPLAYFDMPYVPLYMLAAFSLHWLLGVTAMVSAAIIFILALLAERATRKHSNAAQQAQHRLTTMTEEARRNAEALFALGMKGPVRARWARIHQESLALQTHANDAGATFSAFSRVFRLIVQSAMLGVGAFLAVRHEISSGSIIASSIILGRALAPVEQAVAGWQQLLNARKAYERLTQFFKQVPAEQDRITLPRPKGHLAAEAISVTVPGIDKPLLQNVSFTVAPGTALGVIGPTGAGKSTLARALTGVLPLARGNVRLDGATPDQFGEDLYGRLIGYLPQDVQILDGTVAENISRFSAAGDDAKVVAAAQLADIHEFILRLPQGYETRLQEGGSRLSAGQRQRVALARAVYGDPVLLILDEPNSNLDADGEAALDKAIKATLARGASAVMIAHRPSALNAVTHLLVLANGQVQMSGPRDDVLIKLGMQPMRPPAAAVNTNAPTFATMGGKLAGPARGSS